MKTIYLNCRSQRPKPPPKKAWDTRLTETGVVMTHSASPPALGSNVANPPSKTSVLTVNPPPSGRSSSTIRRDRVQSATLRRPKPEHPKRPVKSAGPCRPDLMAPAYSMNQSPIPVPGDDLRPTAPIPQTPVESEIDLDYSLPATPQNLEYNLLSSYDEQLQKHGWRMEIPGDPFNLK